MIKCFDCQLLKEDSCFPFKKGTLRAKRCKECQRAYAKKHYSKNKSYYAAKARKNEVRLAQQVRAFLNWLKSIPCADCHSVFDPVCMDFDHLRNKKFNISYAVRKLPKTEVLMEELRKCEVVCANCHRLRTKFRNNSEDDVPKGLS